jgi:hypothetical protein
MAVSSPLRHLSTVNRHHRIDVAVLADESSSTVNQLLSSLTLTWHDESLLLSSGVVTSCPAAFVIHCLAAATSSSVIVIIST